MGRLTRDVDLRTTESGISVGTFTLAVNRPFTNASGEREADFVNCVVWRKSAENLSKFAKKGSLIGLEGRIQTRNYENNDGNRIYVTEVIADNFSLLEPKNKKDYGMQDDSHPTPQSSNNFENIYTKDANGNIELNDDDLPF